MQNKKKGIKTLKWQNKLHMEYSPPDDKKY